MKKFLFILTLASLSGLGACDNNQEYFDSLSSRQLPIIGGTQVTGNDYMATVALTLDGNAFCTGTLISPNWVLTAAHCVHHCDDDNYYEYVEHTQAYQKVAFGQSESSFVKSYAIDKFIYHPNFKCNDSIIKNDIALLHLKDSVPRTLAVPIQPMPKSYDMTTIEVDSTSGVTVTTVGFGKTSAHNNNSSGTKFEASYKVYAYCPLEGAQSKKCNSYLTNTDGFIYTNDSQKNTCQGDSGGPTFLTKNGVPFVVGVTSFGYGECNNVSGLTLVSDYYDFIKQYVDDLAADGPENCTNGIDDNRDGRIDCADPYCFSHTKCELEDCTNGIDDNHDGLVDCEDWQCENLKICQPEICDNGIDDNDNGLADCFDSACADDPKCRPENCSNGIDDNENGLIDCEDPDCLALIICQPENCINGKDDNDNGLVDCLDPQCSSQAVCQPEICNNGKDDNDNGLTDCLDPQCAHAIECNPENCTNGKDDNGDGLVDCFDPQCINTTACSKEICDDNIDNNLNGLTDCNDPECFEFCTSSASDVSIVNGSSCSSTPFAPTKSPLWLLLALLPLGLRRKIHNSHL